MKFIFRKTYYNMQCTNEEAFDVEIANEDAEKIVTVGDAVEQIKNAVN